MSKQTDQILTQGLVQGYAGKGVITRFKRSSFSGKSSSLSNNENVYHDEWFVPEYLGGGQELVRVDNEEFTRLYGGGTPDPKYLATLGLTRKKVGEHLKKKIVELGDKTRLYKNCKPDPDGDWQYIYQILETDPNIPVVVAVESIYFKNVRVHIHPFILSPLK